MRVLVDEQLQDVTAATVGEALAAGAAHAEATGRIIVEVEVDGQPWTDEQLDDEQQQDQPAGEVRMTSAEPGDLVRTTFAQADEALERIDRLQRQAAESLQGGEVLDAMMALNDAISIWLAVQQAAMQGTDLLGLQLDEVRIDDEPAGRTVRALNERLVALRDALADGDYATLADTLLYEMPETIGQWRRMFAALIERSTERDGAE